MYPILEINTEKLRANSRVITKLCMQQGIDVAGVVKVVAGNLACAKTLETSGCKYIASSRLDQLVKLKDGGLEAELFCIRIPMLSEVEELVKTAEISLNSNITVLRKLNEAAKDLGVIHKVVLMIELGDLREGIWSEEEYVAIAKEVETGLSNLHLLGVGTNVGCYGAISPTADKLNELVEAAEKIETAIGRRLEMISGGGSTSFVRVLLGDMPERINNLRIGEAIFINKDNEDLLGLPQLQGTFRDVSILKAEVVEVRTKPSHPIGEISYDAFRNKPTYVDRGDRKRVLLAIGKVDYAYIDQLEPLESGIEVLGASSDHTILDVENANRDFKVGDIVEFGLTYGSTALLASSGSVAKVIV
ncbi:MAG: alanine racemase [Clostridiales Family XIII bacterium]|jgi:predicted amino acid racemase|nr:alanine racemase [Clostridiales Family XIII bacterium]